MTITLPRKQHKILEYEVKTTKVNSSLSSRSDRNKTTGSESVVSKSSLPIKSKKLDDESENQSRNVFITDSKSIISDLFESKRIESPPPKILYHRENEVQVSTKTVERLQDLERKLADKEHLMVELIEENNKWKSESVLLKNKLKQILSDNNTLKNVIENYEAESRGRQASMKSESTQTTARQAKSQTTEMPVQVDATAVADVSDPEVGELRASISDLQSLLETKRTRVLELEEQVCAARTTTSTYESSFASKNIVIDSLRTELKIKVERITELEKLIQAVERLEQKMEELTDVEYNNQCDYQSCIQLILSKIEEAHLQSDSCEPRLLIEHSCATLSEQVVCSSVSEQNYIGASTKSDELSTPSNVLVKPQESPTSSPNAAVSSEFLSTSKHEQSSQIQTQFTEFTPNLQLSKRELFSEVNQTVLMDHTKLEYDDATLPIIDPTEYTASQSLMNISDLPVGVDSNGLFKVTGEFVDFASSSGDSVTVHSSNFQLNDSTNRLDIEAELKEMALSILKQEGFRNISILHDGYDCGFDEIREKRAIIMKHDRKFLESLELNKMNGERKNAENRVKIPFKAKGVIKQR